MKNSDFKTAITLVVFVISLGLLLGGYKLYVKYTMVEPVKQQLQARPAISNVDVARADGQYRIAVQLQQVDNLQQEYIAIQETLDKTLKKTPYKLTITDPAEDKLRDAYVRLQPAIYEAVASNRYVWLDQTLSQYAASTGISYHIYVDERFLYLHLADGDGNLYRVIDLKAAQNIT
jgi:hypothetical protein